MGCSENKNVSKEKSQVSEGAQEKDSIRKGQNELILAKKEKGHMLYLIWLANTTDQGKIAGMKLLISNDSWYPSSAGGTRGEPSAEWESSSLPLWAGSLLPSPFGGEYRQFCCKTPFLWVAGLDDEAKGTCAPLTWFFSVPQNTRLF